MSFSEWKTYQISELGKVVTGKTPPTKDKENFGNEYPFITPVDMNGQKTIYKTERNLSEIGKNKVKNFLLPKDAVCISCIGSDLGKVVKTSKPSLTNQQINSIICNDNFDSDYVYYSLKLLSPTLKNIGHQSTAVPIINKTDFSKFEIDAPVNKTTQQRIASILSSLDDAIELNQQINKTLEEMSKAIFKEWFVDFNFPAPLPLGEAGVRAFQETEIGKIPVGWKSMKLNEALEIKYGKDHKHLQDGEFPVYGSGGIMRYAEKPLYESESILIPRKGTLSNLFYINKPFWTVDTMFYSKIKIKDSGKYLFHLLQTLNLASMNVGSAVPSLTTEVLNNIQIAMPDKKTLEEFEKIVSSLFNQAEQNIEENQSLINLRDTLLPKLMKGEIETNEHLPDVGKMMSK